MERVLFEKVRAVGTPRVVPSGHALFVEGEGSERVYVIVRGWVLISCVTAGGRDAVLSLAGPGDLLGEVSAVDGGPRSATAIALTRVDALVAPAAVVRSPELAGPLLRMLAARLREADRRRVEFATQPALGRVASRLLELVERFAHPDGDDLVIEMPLSQEQLASWCAASRESTVKALATLRGLGCLTTGRHRVVVHDLVVLRRHAGAER